MDMTWVTDRIAVGGGIWVVQKMQEVAQAGVTHVIDMQIEFDDTYLGKIVGVEVLWNPVDDDFEPKHPVIFERGVHFALRALEKPGTKLFVHCAAGVHRAPMMAQRRPDPALGDLHCVLYDCLIPWLSWPRRHNSETAMQGEIVISRI